MYYFQYRRIVPSGLSRTRVAAHQFTGNNTTHTSNFLQACDTEYQIRGVGRKYEYDIPTKTGIVTVTIGDWIVQHKGGELEVFSPHAFIALYKLASHTQIVMEPKK